MKPILTLLVALLGITALALAGGRDWLTPGDLWLGLRDGDFVLTVLRGPRVALAIGAGAALGLAGALMQGLTRNPLATPDVIGLVQSAGLGHMLGLSLGFSLFFGEVLGAALALMAVTVLARGQGPIAFVLYGIGIGATATAATTVLLLRAPEAEAGQMMLWLSGSLARADFGTARTVYATLAVVILGVGWQMHRLNTLWLGDEMMRGLGVDLKRIRLIVLAFVAVLTGAATLAVGPIGFLAFIAAPLARAITGAEAPALMPAAILGACLLTGADLVARLMAPIVTLPTGLVMTVIGAPYLIWFLARDRQRIGL